MLVTATYRWRWLMLTLPGSPELLPTSPFEMACVFALFSKLQRVSVLLLKAENARFVSTRPNSYRRTDWYEHE